MLELAQDKLLEAEFFYKRLRTAKDMRSFRYYLSAFLSAARSVTFVLQKELRGSFGEQFDKWYEPERARLAAMKIGAVVVNARNIFLKEGNKLAYVWSTNYPKTKQPAIKLTLKPEVSEITLIRPKSMVELKQADIGYLASELKKLTDVAAKSLSKPAAKVPRDLLLHVRITVGEQADVPLSEFLRDVRAYLDSLQKTLRDAKTTFSK